MHSTMTKKRSTYFIDEELLTALKAMAFDERRTFTSVIEFALEKLLKESEYLDEAGKLTEKSKKNPGRDL